MVAGRPVASVFSVCLLPFSIAAAFFKLGATYQPRGVALFSGVSPGARWTFCATMRNHSLRNVHERLILCVIGGGCEVLHDAMSSF